MSTNKHLHWGIVGAGRIAHTFASDMRHVDNSQVYAVASRNLEDAREFARQYQIPVPLEGYQQLFDHPQVDAVYIATPHNLHYGQVREALLAGKHVLCEKPITVSAEQCEDLIALAKAQGLFLMEAMWTWFLPAIRKARQWVDEGRIGRILHIKADFGYPQPYDVNARTYNPQLAGGCLLDMGIYPLALNLLFKPAPYQSLSVDYHQAPNGVEDDVNWTLRYPDSVSSLGTSFRCRLPNWAFIIGDNGYIAIPDFFRASQASLYVLDQRVEHFEDNRLGSGFEFEIQAATEAIREGRLEAPGMPLSASLECQRQLQAILARIPGVPPK
ncbi:Gfo/Idh/MocA family protein [Bowmanella dokdonensis]|uniref:Gfo/Idh/MocA family oxidoreductase n=1 Tax=Bowmanella dokdonensis TaxID=751969 RepID=A0A939DP93_9ALTE|nr:Gfo/Idh/MocA family oxidoreductase [Bowmanella dokdonensis]MBN7826250.1 Gfo/Idh/MocA family oxidoreductase [Bowmanella dokdonensis]